MKKESNKGRRRLPNGEKKHLIQVFVKAKHYATAKKKIEQIAGKYNSAENNKQV